MEKSYTTKNVKQNNKIAKYVLDILNEKKINIVLLSGELGSGKTTFVKCIAKLLGIKKTVTSPTFLISKEYKIKKVTRYMLHATRLIHYDLYRLRTYNELIEVGFEETISSKKNLILIEWPDKIKGLTNKLLTRFKDRILIIKFYHTDRQNKRKMIILKKGK